MSLHINSAPKISLHERTIDASVECQDEKRAIIVENLTKTYHLYDSHVDRLKQALSPFRRKYYHDFDALRDISFEVKRGEAVGIIGRNGSGKSTLLKIITGVLSPSQGNVSVNGKISALLELGAGFNPELTGLENVYFNGALMGYTRENMDEKLDEVLGFADIGEFISQPVKTYSSGMFVRLAFSLAVNVKPEILIVDEALGVGDVFFQQKCYAKIREILNSQVTLLFVSHDMSAFQNLCDRGILLKNGVKILDGNPIDCASAYYINDHLPMNTSNYSEIESLENKGLERKKRSLAVLKNNILTANSKQQGDKKLEIVSIQFRSQTRDGYNVEFGDYVYVDVLIRANDFIIKPNVGFNLFDRMGNLLFCASVNQVKTELGPMKPNDEVVVSFNVQMNIKNGQYSFAIGASSINPNKNESSYVHHRWLDLGPIQISSKPSLNPINGMVQLPCDITVSNKWDKEL